MADRLEDTNRDKAGRSRTWRTWTDIAELFTGPEDRTWVDDRKLIDDPPPADSDAD